MSTIDSIHLLNDAQSGLGTDALEQIDRVVSLLQDGVPAELFKAIARALHVTGGMFKQQFRATLPGKFKASGSRVGNAFKHYVAGDSLQELKLGVFSMWKLAPQFEFGGTIQPRNSQWLVIPLAKRLFGSDGRVKPAAREQVLTVFGKAHGDGGFKPELFEGLRPVKIHGGWLLIEPKTRTGRGAKRFGGQGVGEPVFMLVKQVHRRPVLRFFQEASRITSIFGPVAVRFAAEHMQRAMQTREAA